METKADRYARQRQFAAVGDSGQASLSAARVAIVGCGALGSVASEILARSGVGNLRLIDRDVVQWSNLQRQSLFDESDATQQTAKADAARTRLMQINSDIRIDAFVIDLVPSNFANALGEVDLVIDAVDNFQLRFLLNDWSLQTKTAWVHGGCVGGEGQVRLFDGLGSPCFRCLVPTPPPASAIATCDTAGVIGAATHAIASLQCVEAIKWLSNNRQAVNTRVQSFDFWNNRHREVSWPTTTSNECPACGHGRYEFLHGELGQTLEAAEVLCGRDSVQIRGGGEVDLDRIADRWQSLGNVARNRFFVRLVIDAHRLTLFRDGRILVDGTDDIVTAKTLATRYLG